VIQGGTQTSAQSPQTTTVVETRPSTSPASTPNKPPGDPAGLRSCGGNLTANRHTSCPFARAVYSTVAVDYGSQQGSYEVYSSVTGTNYTMTCDFEQTRMVCRGGNDAEVSWPG
jgi:hypothetical protein